MWDMNEVIKIEYRGNYVYHILFDDSVKGEIDFSEYLGRGPVFEQLRDITLFSKAMVEGGTISWPNGADVAPEALYEKVLQGHQSVSQTSHNTADAGVEVQEG